MPGIRFCEVSFFASFRTHIFPGRHTFNKAFQVTGVWKIQGLCGLPAVSEAPELKLFHLLLNQYIPIKHTVKITSSQPGFRGVGWGGGQRGRRGEGGPNES